MQRTMPTLPLAIVSAAFSLSALAGTAGWVASTQAGTSAPATTQDAPAKADDAMPKVRLVRILADLPLVRPIQTLQRPGDATNLYVVEQPGRIYLADPNVATPAEPHVVLDIRERVNDSGNEEGLLSVAFHPEFPKKRELYAYYTASKPRRSILSRFTVSEDGRTVDPASEEILLTQSQPYSNHNGGTVLFGPDGMLYLSYGDGGAADDPHGYGQDMSTLLGKVIRIDVSKRGEAGSPYAVPADNPFVGREGARPEIWALGLRNVWRMSFDAPTGDLWAGDVGQNVWEEIDLIVKGGNYGWNAREGLHSFPNGAGEGPFIDPVAEYHHREGVSVTGGCVYRGKAIPELDGVYVYADFVSGNIWGLRKPAEGQAKPKILARKRGSLVASIDPTHDGTLVFTVFDGGQDRGNAGSLWKLVKGE